MRLMTIAIFAAIGTVAAMICLMPAIAPVGLFIGFVGSLAAHAIRNA